MKETLINLKALVPLIGISDNLLEDQKGAANALELNDRAILELLEMSHYLTLDLSENFGESQAIEIKELKSSDIDNDPDFSGDGVYGGRILQFSLKAQYNPLAIESQFDEESISVLGRTGLLGLANDIMAVELRKKIMNFFMTANIAKPGSIGFESGMIYANGHFNTELDYFNCDYLGQEDYSLESVIRLRELPIRKVWDWFDSIEGTAFNTAVGGVGRAIGSLSYAFGPGASRLCPQIVWALLGLEAIYAPKEQLQKYQLTTNIPRLLGKKAVVEDLIEQLYELRLDFIHGGTDFPFAYDGFNELSGLDEDDNEESFQAQHYAILLLIASLQELCERNQTTSPFSDSE